MNENKTTRDVLLSAVWRQILSVTPENVRNVPAADRALAAGASADDLVTAMRAASFETAYGLLSLLIDGESRRIPVKGRATRWALIELDPASGEAGDAGAFDGIYDDLLYADPSGDGHEEFWN